MTTRFARLLILLSCVLAGCGGGGDDAGGDDDGATPDAATNPGMCTDESRIIQPEDDDFVRRRLEGTDYFMMPSYGVRVSRSLEPFCDYVVEFDFGPDPGEFGTGLGQPEVLTFDGTPPEGMHTWPVVDHSTYGPDDGVQSRYSRAGEGLVVTERTGDTIVIYTTDLNVYTLQDVLATYTVKLTAQLIE